MCMQYEEGADLWNLEMEMLEGTSYSFHGIPEANAALKGRSGNFLEGLLSGLSVFSTIHS